MCAEEEVVSMKMRTKKITAILLGLMLIINSMPFSSLAEGENISEQNVIQKQSESQQLFASEDELTVRKTDGTTFRTALRHYESDFLTETYVGRLSNGEQFRFIFASENNPLAQMDPMVTFGSMSTSGWAVHYRVKP